MTENSTELPEVIDVFEICSSGVFMSIGLFTILVVIKLGVHHAERGFRTFFQKLFYACAVNDIFCFLSQLFCLRLPRWGYCTFYTHVRTGIVPTVLYWALASTMYSQFIGTLLIALNRSCSLAFPYSHDKKWNKYSIPIISSMFILPQIFSHRYAQYGSTFNQYGKGYFLIQSKVTKIDFLIYSVYGPVFVSLTLLCNIYTGIKLAGHYRNMKRGKNELRDLRFHIISFLSFLTQLTGTLFLIALFFIADDNYTGIIFEFVPIFSDLATFCPVWFLVIISEETREAVFGKWSEREATTSTVTVTGNGIRSIITAAHSNQVYHR